MNSRSRLPIFAVLTGLFALNTAGAVSYKIASVSPLTGAQSPRGIDLRRGVELALRDRTAELKAADLDVTLVAFDDQASPTRGAQVAQEILANKSILGVVGANNSSVSNVLGEAFAAEQLAMISPNSTNDALTQHHWTHFSRVVAPNSAQAVAAADYVAGTLKSKSVYIVSDNTAYGNSLTKAMIGALKNVKVPVTGYVGASSATDIEMVIKKIKVSGAPLVYFGGTDDIGGQFAKALRASGVSAQLMGGDGLDSVSFIQRANNGAVGVLYTTVTGPINSFSNAVDFIEKYRAAYKTAPGGVSLYAYDATIALLSALEAATVNGAKPSRPQVSAAVRQIDLPACFSSDKKDCQTITGALSFTATGERAISRVLVMKYDELFQTQMLKIQKVSAADAK